MTVSTLTVIVGIFCWFVCKWLFRLLAIAAIGKLIGRAGAEIKNKIKGGAKVDDKNNAEV